MPVLNRAEEYVSQLDTEDAAAFTAADTVVVQWNKAVLQAIRDTHPGPPIVARHLAIVHTCIYDAWSAYDEHAVSTRFGGFLRQPVSERTDQNKRKAMSFAAWQALRDLFPSAAQTAQFDALLASFGYDSTDQSLDPATPSGIGNLMARAVLDFRHGDGSNQPGNLHTGPYTDYTGYVPVNDPDNIVDPNRWQPLRVSDGTGGTVVQRFIAPHWGLVAPFALTSASQFPASPPAHQPSLAYRRQAEQILHFSANLNDESKVIAEYWADGPSSELPPGHWCLFAQFVSERDSHSDDQDAKMFFALTNAVFDASIVCWDAKRDFDYVRPVTAIHFLFAGRRVRAWAGPGLGTRLIDGADWQPYQARTVVTPPFAEYYSGHSTFSAAGAEILASFTGSDHFGHSHTQRAGESFVEPGLVPATDLTLSWSTFSEAADQAGISRRHGGIHFNEGDLEGRRIGRLVGKQAWAKSKQYFDGTV